MLTKEKPYSTEILQAVHTAIVLHSADTSVIVFCHVSDEVNFYSRCQLNFTFTMHGKK